MSFLPRWTSWSLVVKNHNMLAVCHSHVHPHRFSLTVFRVFRVYYLRLTESCPSSWSVGSTSSCLSLFLARFSSPSVVCTRHYIACYKVARLLLKSAQVGPLTWTGESRLRLLLQRWAWEVSAQFRRLLPGAKITVRLEELRPRKGKCKMAFLGIDSTGKKCRHYWRCRC